jgi:hypothetical protein
VLPPATEPWTTPMLESPEDEIWVLEDEEPPWVELPPAEELPLEDD